MSAEASPTGDDGICLSGGGLRAASFSLGVLQVLQSERSLLFGEDSARWLAAVSGGSYVAAAHVLGGRQRAADPSRYGATPPLAPESCEEEHVLTHGRYLLGAPWQWPWLWLLTFSSLLVLFAWAGFLFADAAALTTLLPDGFERDLADVPGGAAACAAGVGFALAVASLYSERAWRRAILAIAGLALLYLGSREAIEWAASLGVFAGRSERLAAAGWTVAALAALGAVTWLLRKLGVTGFVGSVLNIAAVVLTRVVGLIVVAAIAIEWFPDMLALFEDDPDADLTKVAIGLVASLGLPLLFSPLAGRASLHREYRHRLESCFGVVRGEDGKAQTLAGANLREAPPADGPLRFPRLLVCATANVRRKEADGRRWTFRPFVLTHDTSGVPGSAKASFSTAKLELGRVPARVLGSATEPLVSLFTAVAATGAAVSPSMGRHTVPSARPLIAAMNFRLGRWVPNPYREVAQTMVASRTEPGKYSYEARLGSGYDELVPEMLGLDGPRVYLSDGGHYDNLGLVTLLRREPSTVWCVDASPDPRGRASELRRVIGVARDELGVEIELDCEVFRRGSDHLYGATHAEGCITYGPGREGTLVVLKLGLCSGSQPNLRGMRKWLGYPHHPTWRQVYSRTRIEKYRDLGRDTARRALDAGAG